MHNSHLEVYFVVLVFVLLVLALGPRPTNQEIQLQLSKSTSLRSTSPINPSNHLRPHSHFYRDGLSLLCRSAQSLTTPPPRRPQTARLDPGNHFPPLIPAASASPSYLMLRQWTCSSLCPLPPATGTQTTILNNPGKLSPIRPPHSLQFRLQAPPTLRWAGSTV